jgi:phosphatidylglycerol:prolipoprotein diacylglycerol transferase
MLEMPLLAIEIGFDPIIFNIGSLEIGWHGVMVVLAVLTGIGVSLWLAKGSGIKRDTIYSLAPWAVLGGIVGARLFHVIDYFGSTYVHDPARIFHFWAGLSILGAVLGGTLAAAIYSRVTRVSLSALADVITPGLLLAQVVGRIGCIINGDAYGKPTSLPWGLVYTHPNAASTTLLNVAGHPSPAYEIILDLMIFAVIWKLRGRLRPEGSLFLLYLCIYSVGRFGIEFTRAVGSAQINVGGVLHSPHFITMITLVVCLTLFIRRMRRDKVLSSRGEIEDI